MANVLEIILSGNTKELDASLSKTEKRLKDFGDKMKSVGKDMSLYLTTPILALGGASVKFASDFEESLNKVDVAFKSSSQEVKDFAKTALESFGIAEGTALDMASLFGDMSTSMGLSTAEASKLSTSLVGLAGDLASFKNMNIEEVTTALNGVFTGETESLKRLGIVMTEVNLKNFAMEQGMNANLQTMSQAEKVLLRYNYVMAMTTNAQGDFIRTGGGFANQSRVMTEGLKELAQQFGVILLPAMTNIVKKINELIGKFKGLSSSTKTFILIAGGLVASSGPLLILAGTILPKLVTGFRLLTTAVTLFGTSISALTLGGLVALLGTVTYAVIEFKNAMNIKTGFEEEEIKNAEALQKTRDEITKNIQETWKLIEQRKSFGAIFTGGNLVSEEHLQKLLESQYKRLEQINSKINYQNKLKENSLKLAKEIEQSEQKKNQAIVNTDEYLKNATARYKELTSVGKEFLDQVKKENEERKALLTTSLAEAKTKDLTMPTTNINPEQVVTNQITKALEDRKKAMQDAYNNILPIANGIQGVFTQMGEGIIQSLNITGTAFGNFISGMASFLIEYAGMAIKQLLIDKAIATSTATTGAIKTASASGPAFAVVLPAILAGVLGIVGSAFKKVPKFADGGIVSGPTMAMVGEYSGAKSNPEVIAPLDKLQSMMGGTGGNVNVTGEFVVRGQDLVLALQRADQFKNRIS